MFYDSEDKMFVNAAQLAQLLHISRPTLYSWIRLGLPSFKIGNIRRFLLHEVLAWIQAKKMR